MLRGAVRTPSAAPRGDGHVIESWPARLVGERTAGMVASAAQTAANRGSELLIFVPPAAHTGKPTPTPLRRSNSLVRRLCGMR